MSSKINTTKSNDRTLDGIPLMSANCWDAIIAEVRTEPNCRYLEWGAGNSTLALFSEALETRRWSGLEIHSIEHDRVFFNLMVKDMISIINSSQSPAKVSVYPPTEKWLAFSEWLNMGRRVKKYEAHSLKLQWYTGNPSFWPTPTWKEGPTFELSLLRVAKQFARIIQCNLAFNMHNLRSLYRGLIRRGGTDRNPQNPLYTGEVNPNFDIALYRGASLVRFECEGVTVNYYHIPQLQNIIQRKGATPEGLYVEFPDYVEIPLNGKFDVILIDGRARVSCIKRVYYENLLASEGILFVHDACRPQHYEGFHLFGRYSFIRGSRVRANGVSNYPRRGTMLPLVLSGDAMDDLKFTADRELFFYRNQPPELHA